MSWDLVPLRKLITPSSKRNRPDLPLLSVVRDKGVIKRKLDKSDNHNVIPEDLSNYKVVSEGQFVINKMKAWQGSCGVSPYEGIVSPAYFVFDLTIDNPRFFNYSIRSRTIIDEFNRISSGIRVDQWDLSLLQLKYIPFFLPPCDEQNEIVRFLDWKVSGINRLINAKKKQITLLEELYLTSINHSLSCGLNSAVSYKETGIKWIPKIPDTWNISIIKNHFHIEKRIAGKEGYDILSITQKGLKVKDITTNEGQMAANYSNYQFVYPGDFAMNHMDLLTGYVDISMQFGVTSPDYRVFCLIDTENCFPEFFLRIFQLCYKRKIFYGFGQGAASHGRWRMPRDNFLNFLIPLPPINEQREIAAYCGDIDNKTRNLVSKLENGITFLHEYRNRLISDVVTGKLDVRNTVVPANNVFAETLYTEIESADEMGDEG